VVLTLKAAMLEDLRKFRWLESPEEQALAHAEELLEDLRRYRESKVQNQSPKSEDSIQHSVPVFSLTAQNRPHLSIRNTSPASPDLGPQNARVPLHPRYARNAAGRSGIRMRVSGLPGSALTQGRDLLLRNVTGTPPAIGDLSAKGQPAIFGF